MKKIFLLYILLLFSLNRALAVDIRSIQLTTNEGIANNTVRCMYQDSKGFIWMGTLNGLSRYDGSSFVTYQPAQGTSLSLGDHRIRDLEEDKNGLLWIGTSAQIYSCYDLKEERFVDFTGCGEYKELYSDKLIDRNGHVWFWLDGNGCRRVTYGNGKFSSTVFNVANRNLPTDKVYYVFEDARGTSWIGTDEGVLQVVGDRTVMVVPSHSAAEILSDDEDMYFVSSDGKIVMRRRGEKCRDMGRLPGEDVRVCASLKKKNVWVIFTNRGGYEFDLKTGTIRKSEELDLVNADVQKDALGNYWAYNHVGKLWQVDAATGQVNSYTLIPPERVKYIDEERYHIVCDSRGLTWISTYGNGLFVYDPVEDSLQHFTFDMEGASHITSDYLLYLMEDRTGGIWVSSEYAGVSHIQVLDGSVRRLLPEKDSKDGRANTVRMISRTTDGTIWVGTRQGGLYIYDAEQKVLTKQNTIISNVYVVERGADGSLWTGTRGAGLNVDGVWYKNQVEDSTSLGSNNIFDCQLDRKGRMWIGTFGGGLNLAQPVTEGTQMRYTFRRFLMGSYAQRQIRVLEEDRNGWLWAGTSAGVYVFHPDSLMENPHSYVVYDMASGKLRSNEIKCLFQDSKGRMWMGTSGKGLSMCQPANGYRDLSFRHFDVSDGLVNSMVQSITEDEKGRIWIATELGISRLDPDTRVFENFFFASHTLGNAYSENSCARTDEGELLFGSNFGLFVVDPEEVADNVPAAPVVSFTGLHVNGILVSPGEPDSPLTCSMAYTQSVRLKHGQNSWVIDFSTFEYPLSKAVKYTYRLEPYDREWSVPSLLNFAAYKNIPPGHYKLRVKACNGQGVWSHDEAVLDMVITPPFWLTGWAFLVYILLAVVLLYVVFRVIRNFNTLRNRIEVEKRLTEYKLVFFTNISHEFRTPLTLIQGALEKIMLGRKLPEETDHALHVMDKSTKRMLRLINQLLEFRKMQNNKLALSLEETDVIAFLYEIYLSFMDVAESKHMDFKFVHSLASYKMFVDKGHLDKVTYNLLSNAFKYTPSNGRVTLSAAVDESRKKLVMEVRDTGVGIPKEKRNELFKRFMQSSFSGSSVGVGLHLSHELVSVHKGTITYAENEGGGSVFTVTLPTDPAVYEEKDFLIPHNVLLEEEEEKHKQGMSVEEMEHFQELLGQNGPSTSYKILVIEDDNDVREFLKEELNRYFEVVAEADGKAGLERARTYDADLVICDVLMPGMTGFEVTRQLKGDFNTSHIPVILLTAMQSDESQLEGLESGADAYITKPFSPRLLLTRVFKLIEQRKALLDKFSNAPNMLRPDLCASAKDKEFVDRLQTTIEEQLSNPDFTVDELASIMGVSRSIFYRKLRGLTGYSPNEYIRLMRLKKGAELLLEGRYTVAEITYKVGLNDPFYFSRCFKQHFGVSPKAYRGGPPIHTGKGKEAEEK